MNQNHAIVQLERYLAEDAARCCLRSNGQPLEGDWYRIEWRYHAKVWGKRDAAHVRKCWEYAVARGLIKVRRRNEFQLVPTEREK